MMVAILFRWGSGSPPFDEYDDDDDDAAAADAAADDDEDGCNIVQMGIGQPTF